MTRRLLLTVALAGVTAACLNKDAISTWYIDADRRVVWSVEEREVRAQADTADERGRLEDEYILSARQRNHPAARALSQLSPIRVTATVVRDRPPFHVVTEATFPGLAELGERVFARLGLRGQSTVAATIEGWTWTWSLDGDSAIQDDQIDEEFAALVMDAPNVRIALEEGRFLEAADVRLSDDRRVATFPLGDLLDRHKGDGTPTTFVLAWSTR